MIVKLYATRDNVHERFLGTFDNLRLAARHIEQLEDHGAFPEGWEAVAIDEAGQRWHYTSNWEPEER